MNHTQMKYARERALRIKNERAATIQEKYRSAVVELSRPQRLKALRDGHFSVNLKYTGFYLHDAISFDGEVHLDRKGLQKDLDRLEADFTKLNDDLILGDSEAALQLLEAFAAAAA